MTYQAKLIKGGKVVIPAELRREFGFNDGDTVIFEKEHGRLVVKTYADVLRDVREKVRKGLKRPFTVDDYLSEKYAEAARE